MISSELVDLILVKCVDDWYDDYEMDYKVYMLVDLEKGVIVGSVGGDWNRNVEDEGKREIKYWVKVWMRRMRVLEN